MKKIVNKFKLNSFYIVNYIILFSPPFAMLLLQEPSGKWHGIIGTAIAFIFLLAVYFHIYFKIAKSDIFGFIYILIFIFSIIIGFYSVEIYEQYLSVSWQQFAVAEFLYIVFIAFILPKLLSRKSNAIKNTINEQVVPSEKEQIAEQIEYGKKLLEEFRRKQ